MPKLKIPIDECSTCHSKMILTREYDVMDNGVMKLYHCPKCGHDYHRVKRG